jgi:hypothetical protein
MVRRLAYWCVVLGIWGAIGVGGLVLYYGARMPSATSWSIPERPPNVKILAVNGDIVAALRPGPAEDEATIKRLGHDGSRVMLIPENPALSPFEMPDGRILGKVVAVLRKL